MLARLGSTHTDMDSAFHGCGPAWVSATSPLLHRGWKPRTRARSPGEPAACFWWRRHAAGGAVKQGEADKPLRLTVNLGQLGTEYRPVIQQTPHPTQKPT